VLRSLSPGPNSESSHVYPIYSNMRLIKMVDFQPIISAILLFQYHHLVSKIVAELGQMDLRNKKVLITSCAFGNVIPRVVKAAIGSGAERVLIAAECIGDGRWFIEKASRYASERIVFGRPIGANQGVQFPIAQAYAQIEAADLMRYKAAWLFEQGLPCGAEANTAKLLAAEASWQAANACLDTHGGFGFAEEYDVERKFRETRLYKVAPVSNNLILAYLGQHVLGMPRSY